MTDVEERLQRALRIIADDLTVPGELDLVQDQPTTRTLMEPTVEPSGRQQRWPFAVAAAAALVGVVMLAALLWGLRPRPPRPRSSTRCASTSMPGLAPHRETGVRSWCSTSSTCPRGGP